MTHRQFIIARFFKKFGFEKKNKRLTDAATELQLLREAEDILGKHVWERTEGIDQFKLPYWELRKLIDEKQELIDKIQSIEGKIETIKQNKFEAFTSTSSSNGVDLETMLQQQTDQVQILSEESEDIARVGKNIRTLYDGLILKMQSLEDSNAKQEEIDTERKNIEKLKAKFSSLKQKKTLCDSKLKQETRKLEEVSQSIKMKRNSYKDEASGSFEIMGKANKAISAYRLKMGLIDSKISRHHGNIGKAISKEYFVDAACKNAVSGQSSLCKVMKALRQSIEYNYTLVGR